MVGRAPSLVRMGESRSRRRALSAALLVVAVLVAPVMGVVAPSRAAAQPAVSGTAGHATSRAAVAGLGALKVVVSGLPAGKRARVVVTGPRDYRRTVTATTTLTRLRTGTYRVTASAVTVIGGTATVVKRIQSVAVVAARTRSVAVRYVLPSRGQLSLTVQTPEGVPATVDVRKSPTSVVVGKAPSGTSQKFVKVIAIGTWTLTPQPVYTGGRLYAAPAKVVTVRAARDVSATIVYAVQPTVTEPLLTDVATDSLTVSWTGGEGLEEVAVRVAPGSTAPATVADGTAVPVTGSTATAAGLSAATEHAFSVFSRSGGAWYGPIVVSGTTLSAPGSDDPSYVLAPGALRVPESAAVSASTLANGNVRVTLPAGVRPTIGQGVLVPPGLGLPLGYLGSVVAIATNGDVVLAPGSIDQVFDYLDVDVAEADVLPSAQRRTTRMLQRAAADCGLSGSGSVSADPSLAPQVGLTGTLATRSTLGIPTSVGMDFETSVVITLTLPTTVELSAGWTCSPDIGPFAWPFAVGPVPMVALFDPVLELSVTGSASVTATFTVTGGFSARGYVPFPGQSWGNTRIDDADPIASADVSDPTGTLAATVRAELGGEIAVGVGVAIPGGSAGVLAGLGGRLDLADLSLTAKADTGGQACFEARAALSGSIDILGKAWFHGWEGDLRASLLDFEQDYPGSPWVKPLSCIEKYWTGTIAWTVESDEPGTSFDAEFVEEWSGGPGEITHTKTASGSWSTQRYCSDPGTPTTFTGEISGSSSESLTAAQAPRYFDPPDTDWEFPPLLWYPNAEKLWVGVWPSVSVPSTHLEFCSEYFTDDEVFNVADVCDYGEWSRLTTTAVYNQCALVLGAFRSTAPVGDTFHFTMTADCDDLPPDDPDSGIRSGCFTDASGAHTGSVTLTVDLEAHDP